MSRMMSLSRSNIRCRIEIRLLVTRPGIVRGSLEGHGPARLQRSATRFTRRRAAACMGLILAACHARLGVRWRRRRVIALGTRPVGPELEVDVDVDRSPRSLPESPDRVRATACGEHDRCLARLVPRLRPPSSWRRRRVPLRRPASPDFDEGRYTRCRSGATLGRRTEIDRWLEGLHDMRGLRPLHSISPRSRGGHGCGSERWCYV